MTVLAYTMLGALVLVFVVFFWSWDREINAWSAMYRERKMALDPAPSDDEKWYRVTDLNSEPIEVWKQVTHRRTQYRLTAAGDGPNGRGEG